MENTKHVKNINYRGKSKKLTIQIGYLNLGNTQIVNSESLSTLLGI